MRRRRDVFPTDHDRIPPASLEAEMALLGAVLVDPTLFEEIATRVRPQHFYAALHETIFTALCTLVERGEPIDRISLAEQLRVEGMLDKVGGIAYLGSLVDTVPTASSAQHYAKIVREKAAARALIAIALEIQDLGYGCEDEVPLAIDRAETLVRTLRERFDGAALRPQTLREVGVEYDRLAREAPAWVLSSCWPTINGRLRGGFRPGLHGWSAAGKAGKSHAVRQLALWDAHHHGYVLLFAIEEGRVETHVGLVEMLSGVTQHGNDVPSERERDKIRAAREILEEGWAARLLLYGDPNEPITSHQLCVEAKRQAARLDAAGDRLASVIVDVVSDLADVRGENGAAKDEPSVHVRQKLAFKRLRDLAQQLRVPVHAVTHQNAKTGDARPSRNNVRDGGDLHLTAENLILIWREDRVKEPERGLFIIDAARHGAEGPVPMRYARGLWLDQGSKLQQDRAWFEAAPAEQIALDGGSVIATEVDGIPARIVAHHDEYDDLEDARRLFGSTN